ncbi:putative 26S proteasome regulatory subunit RPN13 [Cryptosporidium felis]|nr:putative 26S proteasome regulatory subunit RPN13 [Cryptosporidium felis]
MVQDSKIDNSQESSQIVKEYKVGKMMWDGKVVQACTDKGKLELFRSKDASQPKLRWHNLDKKVFENEVEVNKDLKVEKINESRSNKVFVLKISGKPAHLYWIQDNQLDIDHFIKEINDEISLLSHQVNSFNDTLRKILNDINDARNTSNTNGILQENAQTTQISQRISLSNILTSQVLDEIKNDPDLLEELKDQMPAGQGTVQDVHQALNCPQVKYTLRLLDETIYSEQILALSAALGLGINFETLINKNPMHVFIKALNEKYNK